MAVCYTEPELMPIEVRIFDHYCSCDIDLDPMTFVYELDPYSLEIYRMSKYEFS